MEILLRISRESLEKTLETSLEYLKRISREVSKKSQWDIDMGGERLMRKGNNIKILYKILTLFFSKHTIMSINEIFYYYVRYRSIDQL